MKKFPAPDALLLRRSLFKALDALDADLLSVVLAGGASIEGCGVMGYVARTIKARTPTDVLRILLDAGADPNEWDPLSGPPPPLCSAVLARNPQWVQMLLEAGADPNDQRHPIGALTIAITMSSGSPMVALLKKHGADPLRCGNQEWWRGQKAEYRAWYEQAQAQAAAAQMSSTMPSASPAAAAPRKRL